MKKIIALLLILSLQMPVFASYIDKQLKDAKKTSRYNTVQKHKKNYDKVLKNKTVNYDEIKDPGLIKLSDVEPVDKKLYEKKLKQDEALYNSKIKKALVKKSSSVSVNNPDEVDFYNLYRISERLIRANNLDYINWRIAIRKSEDFNASSFEGNYIRINTALYDTLYNNEDALAFVLGHEMAHHVFGHSQRVVERERFNEKLAVPMACLLYAAPIAMLIKNKMDVNEDRVMEYMADAEAFKFLITAGYSPDRAMEALNFIAGMPNIETIWTDHPKPANRIENIKEYYSYMDPNWVEIGKNNIYNSTVLGCKKSSDRVSIVISKAKNPDNFYEPEDAEHLLTRIAYRSYKTGNMENAAKYFYKLTKIKEDYVTYLYLSYCCENLYKQTKEEKYLKRAIKATEKAKELAGDNEYVLGQCKDLKNIDL